MNRPTGSGPAGRALVAAMLALAAAGGLAGCASGGGKTSWNDADRDHLGELASDPWLAPGTAVAPTVEPQDLWLRPTVARVTAAPAGATWQTAAAEVAAAEKAGWTLVFTRCAGPGDGVSVELERTLTDGTAATATVRVDPRDAGVTVEAVAAHHLDDPITFTTSTVDRDVCLTGPGAALDIRWSGAPVALPLRGGPAPE